MVGLGQGVQLYPGLTKWFERLGEYATKLNCNIEHYVISSGIKEMIEGTNIYKYFTRVYACEYFYGEDGTAVWPKNVVNYTTKTQFLFRISKVLLNWMIQMLSTNICPKFKSMLHLEI